MTVLQVTTKTNIPSDREILVVLGHPLHHPQRLRRLEKPMFAVSMVSSVRELP